MTVAEIRERVKSIQDKGIRERDYEAAHGMEDDLYRDVLQQIASNPRGAQRLAEEALKTKNFDFARHAA